MLAILRCFLSFSISLFDRPSCLLSLTISSFHSGVERKDEVESGSAFSCGSFGSLDRGVCVFSVNFAVHSMKVTFKLHCYMKLKIKRQKPVSNLQQIGVGVFSVYLS